MHGAVFVDFSFELSSFLFQLGSLGSSQPHALPRRGPARVSLRSANTRHAYGDLTFFSSLYISRVLNLITACIPSATNTVPVSTVVAHLPLSSAAQQEALDQLPS